MRVALLLVLLGLQSCATPTPGPASHEGRYCRVTVPEGWRPEWARGIAIAADSVAPSVAEKLSLPPTHCVVNLMPERFLDDRSLAARFKSPPPRIELGSVCMEQVDRLESLLAHELVHMHAFDAGWSVPYVVEEVVAEFIARPHRGIPEQGVLAEAIPATRAELEALFALSHDEVRARPEEAWEPMYRQCLSFLRTVGFSSLLAMLHAGQTSPEELLAAFESAR